MALTKAEARQLAELEAKRDAKDDAPAAGAKPTRGARGGSVYVLEGDSARDFVTRLFGAESAEADEFDDEDQDDDDGEEEEEDDGEEEEDAPPPDPPAGHGHKFFSGRQRA